MVSMDAANYILDKLLAEYGGNLDKTLDHYVCGYKKCDEAKRYKKKVYMNLE
jgi:hypothetical protein